MTVPTSTSWAITHRPLSTVATSSTPSRAASRSNLSAGRYGTTYCWTASRICSLRPAVAMRSCALATDSTAPTDSLRPAAGSASRRATAASALASFTPQSDCSARAAATSRSTYPRTLPSSASTFTTGRTSPRFAPQKTATSIAQPTLQIRAARCGRRNGTTRSRPRARSAAGRAAASASSPAGAAGAVVRGAAGSAGVGTGRLTLGTGVAGRVVAAAAAGGRGGNGGPRSDSAFTTRSVSEGRGVSRPRGGPLVDARAARGGVPRSRFGL